MAHPVFDSTSLPFVEDMFRKFNADKSSVPAEWQAYFAGWLAAQDSAPAQAEGGAALPSDAGFVAKAIGVARLIRAWRMRGHKLARINPLRTDAPNPIPELALDFYGLSQADMDSSFPTLGILPQTSASLRDIFTALQTIYGGATGIETAPLSDGEARRWVQAWWENPANYQPVPAATKRKLYEGLVRAGGFEKFLHTKFVGVKRFSLEGTDAIIPLLSQLVEMAGADGAKHVVMGMAHRGRLNTLCNIVHKPLNEMLAAFSDKLTQEGGPSSGDVKYHLGKTYMHHLENGTDIELNLLFNPSHLEAVNPLVLGMAKAKQTLYGPAHKNEAFHSVLPILMHGDSAVIGQGVVAECNNLMKLPAYDVGGTLHIVINNQVGFTADPVDAFSGEYCTDIFRGFNMPIIHVNADDIEAAYRATRFAIAFRNQFARDVVIDLVGYRRWGHNEGDDPTFTQPVMYRTIKEHPTPAEVYRGKLLAEGSLTEQTADIIVQTYTDELNKAFTEAQAGITSKAKAGTVKTGSMSTAATRKQLDAVASAWSNVPTGGEVNAKVKRVLDERAAMLKGEAPLNWGAAETAAYGTLLQQGIGWRITGQDVQRGTFSHRHAVMTLAEDGAKWAALSPLRKDEGTKHEVFNSALSENAVLGFEYGYALADTNTLVMWEAQFGDFANGAQVIFDQFIASAEAKWGQQNHITVLLPHGYEGQGPEHSSARIERFLQLCAEDNMRVVVPSTPAQVFHLLRKQGLLAAEGGPRKPLIVFTPKSLLRNPMAVSPVEDLLEGGFQRVLNDTVVDAKKAKKVVLCSGKVYYDLLSAREKTARDDVALIRIEQLYPWPEKDVADVLSGIKAKDVFWVQEEPRNMGACTFVRENWAKDWGYLHTVARRASASPAAGTTSRHAVEQQAILDEIFGK